MKKISLSVVLPVLFSGCFYPVNNVPPKNSYIGTPIRNEGLNGYPNSHWNNPQSVMSSRSNQYMRMDRYQIQTHAQRQRLERTDIRNSTMAARAARDWVRVEREHNRNTIGGAATEATRGIIKDSGRSISEGIQRLLGDLIGGRGRRY